MGEKRYAKVGANSALDAQGEVDNVRNARVEVGNAQYMRTVPNNEVKERVMAGRNNEGDKVAAYAAAGMSGYESARRSLVREARVEQGSYGTHNAAEGMMRADGAGRAYSSAEKGGVFDDRHGVSRRSGAVVSHSRQRSEEEQFRRITQSCTLRCSTTTTTTERGQALCFRCGAILLEAAT